MSTYPVTTSLNVVKKLQYVKQTVRGSFPSSAVFVLAQPIQDFTPNFTTNSSPYRRIGDPDIFTSLKTGERFNFDISYQPQSRDLLKIGVNIPSQDPTDNRDNILGFLYSQQMNEAGTLVEKFVTMRDCQCNSTSIDVSLDAVAVSQNWIGSVMTVPGTTHGLPGTPTFAPDVTTDPWTGISSGLDPLTWNATTPDIRAFNCEIGQNIDEIQPLGNVNVVWANPTLRDITFSFDAIYEDNSLINDCRNHTKRAMEMKLSADTKLVFTNAQLMDYNETISATSAESKMISYSGIAQRVLVTTV